MAGIDVKVIWKTRKAIYRPNKWRAKHMEVPEGAALNVLVHGVFQCSDDDGHLPYFVVELENGRCHYADITEVQFTDTEEEMRQC